MFVESILAGRVALVTGASRGLGRHFAGLLARHGAQVVGLARDTGGLAALAAELAARGHALTPLAADVRDGACVERAIGEAIARAGRLDIVVNNAGIALTKPAKATSDDEWNAVIDTNLSGAFRVARSAAAAMEAQGRGGSIVNIASVLARRVAKQLPAYIAAKAALVKLTEALALEWAPIGVRVNALAPGYIETDINRDFLASPAGQSIAKRVPQRRFGKPADLDGALLLLASDAGRYITGTTIGVDGGHALAWL
jgi:NAD(P)-dependent dehydrogenase (short-subunit alcohol dehydrogenase family)